MEYHQVLCVVATSLYISNQVKTFEEGLDRAAMMLEAAKRHQSNN